MPYGFGRLERAYAQIQTSFRTIPNTTGTWNSGTAKWIRHASLQLNPTLPVVEIPWKTGTRSRVTGTIGRKGGTWSLPGIPVIPSGAAGTAPDLDPLFQAAFGGAGTNVPATSHTYNLIDTAVPSLVLASFQKTGGTLTNRLAWGCIVEQVDLVYNGDIFVANFSGSFAYMIDSDYFSSEDTVGKAGLTVSPAEPGSPSVNGSQLPGFGGTFTVDSQTGLAITSMGISIRTGNVLKNDAASDGYAFTALGGARSVSVSLSVQDDDSAALQGLKNKSKTKAAITISAALGSTAGSIVTATANAVQLTQSQISDDQVGFTTNFGTSMAHATTISGTNDVVLQFT